MLNSFHFTTHAQHIYFSAGALERLPAAVASFGWRRLRLCTSGSARKSGRAGQVEALLGERLAAVFDRVQPHVPDFQVDEALALAAQHGIDALIGLGGGSALGLAKAVSHALAAGMDGKRRVCRPRPF